MGKRKCKITLAPIVRDKLEFYSSFIGNPLNCIKLPNSREGIFVVVISVRMSHYYNYKWKFRVKSWSSLWYAKDFEL